MKSIPFGVLVATVVVASLLSAVVTSFVTAPDAPQSTVAPVADASDGQFAQTREQLAALVKADRELLVRLAALEQRPSAATDAFGGKGAVTEDDLLGLQKKVEGWMAGLEKRVHAPEALKAGVGTVLKAIRKSEAEEKVKTVEERRLRRQQVRFDKLRRSLNLSDHQVARLRTLDDEYHEFRTGLRVMVEEGVPRQELGPMNRSFVTEQNAALASFLTPAQLAGYQAQAGAGAGR